jgi:neutral ceramidase
LCPYIAWHREPAFISMNTSHSFRAGWAEVDFTPAPGLPLLGQMHERIATHARDPLCAIAFAVRSGDTTTVIIACDVCVLDNEFVTQAQKKCAEQTGIAESHFLIHATHTHVAPISTGALMAEPLPEFEKTLQNTIVEAALQALQKLEPVEVFAASGHLEQLGWNRRAMFSDGTSRMYGNSEMPEYIGMEGPRDPHLPLLWTKNQSGEITGVLTGFATHPNCLEGESFYSADLPGAARKHLRKLLGENTRVLYLTGAAGNTAPSVLDPYNAQQPWRGDEGVERSGLYLAGEAAKVVASTLEPMTGGVLSLNQAELLLPLRQWPEVGEPTYPQWAGIDYYENAKANWPQRLKENNPFPVRLSVLRIGDAAICTNPAELFVEFGIQIKTDSPAAVTFISQLTNGYCGYVPTEKAFARGGYETWCAPSSQMMLQTGAQIALQTQKLLSDAWSK